MRRDSPALLFYFFSFFYLSLPNTFLGRLLAMRAQTHKTVERVASLWFCWKNNNKTSTQNFFLFDQQGPRFVISSGPDAAGMSETRRHWHTQTSEIEWERERVGCDVALECKWLHNLKETCVIPVVSSLFWVCVFFFVFWATTDDAMLPSTGCAAATPASLSMVESSPGRRSYPSRRCWRAEGRGKRDLLLPSFTPTPIF